MIKILLADDDKQNHEIWHFRHMRDAHNHDYEFLSVFDGKQAIEALDTYSPHILMLDYVMPGRNGCYVARYARKHHPDCVIILKTCLSNKIDCPGKRFDEKFDSFNPALANNWMVYLDAIVQNYQIKQTA